MKMKVSADENLHHQGSVSVCVCEIILTAEGHGAPSLSHASLSRPVGVDRLDGEETLPPLTTRPPLGRLLIGRWAGRTRLLLLLLLLVLVFFCSLTGLLRLLCCWF